jgi:hypothetical protein
MDNGTGTNDSHAQGGARPSLATATSWNPALRPDHHENALALIKPSEPLAGVNSQLQAATESSEDEEEEDEDDEDEGEESEEGPEDESEEESEEEDEEDEEELPAAAPPARAMPMHDDRAYHVKPKTKDDFFDRQDSDDMAENTPQGPPGDINGHGVAGSENALVSGMDGLGIEDPTREDSDEQGSGSHQSQEDESGSSDGEDEHLADNYEHQGETTLLDDAVTESENAPLVADAGPVSDDWDESDQVFDLGGMPQDVLPSGLEEHPLATPQAEAVGTTVGDDVIGNTRVGGNAGEDIDWGANDDQDFFGGAATQQDTPNGQTATAGDPAWDLALDDDFLPDADEASAPFDLDDDGFLDDTASEPPVQPTATSAASKYAPQASQVPQPSASPYGTSTPQFTNLSQMHQNPPVPAVTSSITYGGYGQPTPYQQQPTRPAMPSSAQSFADKSKGGYSSPYDLPEGVVTTRKRAAPRPVVVPSAQPVLPPPRSSSMTSVPGVQAPRPPLHSNATVAHLSPPSSSQSNQATMSGVLPPVRPAAVTSPSSDFFAELPLTSKPKPPGRYMSQQIVPQHPPAPHAPQHAPPHAPPMLLQKERTASWSSLRNEVLPDSDNVASQLRQPEQLPVFPDQPSVPVRSNSLPMAPPAPPATSRYSPAPPLAAPPVANSRYSPAPPPSGPSARYSPAPPPLQGPVLSRHISEPSNTLPRVPVQPYAPRTSSPLAYQPVTEDVAHQAPGHQPMHSADGIPRPPFRSPLEGVSEAEERDQAMPASVVPPMTARSETPPIRSTPPSLADSPRKGRNYSPQYQPASQPATSAAYAPVHSPSQSPEVARHAPRQSLEQHRPASTYGYPSAASTIGIPASGQDVVNIIPPKLPVAHDFEFIPPQDERASDPLERWKGYPIFKWGLGGTVITSFPKQIPRYGGGASMPMMKCSPGEVRIQSVKEAFPLPEEIAKFPGPLKGKSKKKDVSTWLTGRIKTLENRLNAPLLGQSLNADDNKRLEEMILLWKVLQVLVDNDGHLEGSATAEAAVRKVLSPADVDSSSGPEESFSTAADLVGLARSETSALPSEPVNPRAVEQLRKLLAKGDREKAVWHAVDQNLWPHAMLLSSTLNRDVWKQVVQEFVRKEVKKAGPNNQALAVLYEIFAGNWEDCIDELVPASARAGFQMVGADGAGSTQNAVQGLDKWRETLSLVLNNRSAGDTAALVSLGRLLAGYGRVEAAHICFIFARSSICVSGADDSNSDLVLISANHKAYPLDLGNDLEPVLLTEIYEFALSLSAQGGANIIPHLQIYKLAHAYTLAEYGYRTEAMAYCDAIATSMKATTKPSPYYNASFIGSLDDLSKRLSQSPKDGSSSWISKPSMDKVSSSLLSKFNSFIAGEDENAASTRAGQDVGPFAKIAGATPSMSPTHSNADLYGTYSGYGGATAPPPAASNSRYAPPNAYAPRSSSEQMRPTYEPQGRASMESHTSTPYMPSTPYSGSYSPSQSQFSPTNARTEAKVQSYAPLMSPSSSVPYGNPYQPTPPAEEATPGFGGYQPPQASSDEQLPSPPADTTQTFGGYEPPTSSYEPPSYQPYNPDAEPDSPVEEKKKKSTYHDDDDDDNLAKRAAALKPSSQKSEADRKADEAFRKAAEADAQRDNDSAAAKKGGWFGGWFGGKKESGDLSSAPNKPIKAKLGEENSFVYDPDLKKWINKKGGAQEATASKATPPPPRSGPPSRSVSNQSAAGAEPGAMGPPSAFLSRPPTSNPILRSTSMPPPMLLAPDSRASTPGVPSDNEGGVKPPPLMPPSFVGSGPPSRPGTGLSTSSSIDDLLGAPSAKKGSVRAKKRGGRYVDVMAQK